MTIYRKRPIEVEAIQFTGDNVAEIWDRFGERDRLKTELDELHKRKIDLADEVLVLNVDGYIGSSTRSEIEYAQKLGRPVRYLEEATTA